MFRTRPRLRPPSPRYYKHNANHALSDQPSPRTEQNSSRSRSNDKTKTKTKNKNQKSKSKRVFDKQKDDSSSVCSRTQRSSVELICFSPSNRATEQPTQRINKQKSPKRVSVRRKKKTSSRLIKSEPGDLCFDCSPRITLRGSNPIFLFF